jgi:tetratricopeptide (TPR) repeat protein
MNNPASTGRNWKRVARPIACWLILVLVLFGIREHQRLSAQTRLFFTVSMSGQPLYAETSAKVDGKLIESGNRISVGFHQLLVENPKAESYSTNLFIWYGTHELGDIILKRSFGNLTVTVTPPADSLIIRGPEWSVTLNDSSGTNALVPTDTYDVEADYPNSVEKRQLIIYSRLLTPLTIAPRFGIVQLSCNQSDATYQLKNSSGQNVSIGSLPAIIAELPMGSYNILATHHGNQRQTSVFVQADVTNTMPMNFDYGVATFETTPSGAAVLSDSGRQYGETPLTLSDLPADSTLNLTLQRYGYAPVQISLYVSANQTNFISTNLVSVDYINAMNEANQYLAVTNLDAAEKAVNRAVQVSPSDPTAVALQRRITILSSLQKAEFYGAQSNYIAGIKYVQTALTLEPDNAEAKQLQAEFKNPAAEQLQEQQRQQEVAARMNRPREELDKLLAGTPGLGWFQTQEMDTEIPVSTIVANLPTVLQGPLYKLTITSQYSPTPDITVMVIKQGGTESARVCGLVIGRVASDKTQILFKIIESANTVQNPNSIASILNLKGARDYQTIQPAYGGVWTTAQNMQIQEGIQLIRETIQKAIDKPLAIQPAVSQ